MSIKIMSQIWELTDLDQPETLVALALADHANDNGLCWPGIDRIAAKARMSRRNAVRILQRLEGYGILEISRLKGQTSRYKLTIPQKLSTGGDRLAHPPTQGVTNQGGVMTQLCHGGGDTAMSHESSVNHQKESSGNEDALKAPRAERADPERVREIISRLRAKLAMPKSEEQG